MSLALLLASASLYYLYRPKPSISIARDDTFTSVLIGSMYLAAGLSAIWYPGTEWIDPEFKTIGGPERPQMYIFGATLGVAWLGWGVEVSRLGRRGTGKGE